MVAEQVIRILACAAVTGLLSGCAGLPDLSPEGVIPFAAVVDRIECELAQAAAQPGLGWFDYNTWAATYTLTLKADSQIDVGAGGGWANRGVFKLADIAVGGSQTGHRDTTVKYDISLKKLVEAYRKNPSSCVAAIDGSHPFLGQLGIPDWLRRVALSRSNADTAMPSELTYEVDFGLEFKGGLTPSFSFVRAGTTWPFATSRSDKHTFILVLDPVHAPAGPTEVIIVGNKTAKPIEKRLSERSVPVRRIRPGAITPGIPLDTQIRLNNGLTNQLLRNLPTIPNR